VGKGHSYDYLQADGTFSATQNGNQVTFNFNGTKGDFWTLMLAAPPGDTLAAGKYSIAQRDPFNSPVYAGISFQGNGAGCNVITGNFVVHEIAFGTGNQVTRLVADFQQNCDSTGLLTGTLRYNSTTNPNYFDPSPAEAYPPPAPDPGYVVVLDSQTGDYIGGGINQTWDNSEGVFTASHNMSDNSIQISYNGGAQNNWTLVFSAPSNALLAAGTYSGAARYPFQLSSQPGLSITGDGRGCNTDSGSFTINQVTYDGSGHVLTFYADFTQVCDNDTGSLTGSIRYNAPPPPVP
jgi:hypothetical protein